MKNIHILPTEEESRLQVNKHKKMFLSQEPKAYLACINQNINITNTEEIKEGDWIFDIVTKKIEIAKFNHNDLKRDWKKIILTTDQDLIKDGVQAIDIEFLEWLVKKPSCEEVEIDTIKTLTGSFDAKGIKSNYINVYKIIIPKKNFYCGDKFDYDEQCEFQCDTCVNKKGVDYGYLPKEEPKKVLTEKDIFNQKDIDAVTDYINKEQQKQHLIDMIKSDEELGLYDEPKTNNIMKIIQIKGEIQMTKRYWWQLYKRNWYKHTDLWCGLWWIRFNWDKEDEQFKNK